MRQRWPLRLSLAALVAVSVAIPTSASAVSTLDPGIAVATSAHELPAPAISLADDGRALVVWTGDNPASDTRCTENGANCVIMGRLMNADGTFDGDAFAVAADVPINYYYAPASVAWNSTANEWLVTFSVTPNDVFAQRVSATAALLGERRLLPAQQVTAADDRTEDGIIDAALINTVNAKASWSSEHNAYLVTWWSHSTSAAFRTAFGISSGLATFGMFLNSDLTSADGLEASFVLSDDGIGTVTRQGYTAETAYDPTTGTWLTTWVSAANDERTGAHVTLEPSISVSEPFTISDTAGWNADITGGSTVWVAALESYIVTWTGRRPSEPDIAIWGRTIDGSTLGPVTKLSALTDEDFGGTSAPAFAIRRSSVADNGTTLQIAAGAEYGIGYRALTWSVDLATLTPSAAVTRLVGVTDGESARPQVAAGGSGFRVVWQDWPNGDYSDGGEVRVTGGSTAVADLPAPEEPELADTGVAELGTMATLAALLLALGAAVSAARRPRRTEHH